MMATERITDVASWLHGHASLHDVIVEKVDVDCSGRTVTLDVCDLDIDSEGEPDYRERPCQLVFGGVSQVGLDVDLTEDLWIGDAKLTGACLEIGIGGRIGPYGHRFYPTLQIAFATLDVIDRE
jgi:hypothetical protein